MRFPLRTSVEQSLRKLILLGIFLAAPSAFATLSLSAVIPTALVFEPAIGYTTLGSIGTSGSTNDTYNGLTVGAKLLFVFANFLFFGPDVTYLPSLNYAPANSSTTLNSNPLNLKVGGVIGLELPYRVRAWFGTNYDAFLLNETTSGVASTTILRGYSLKVGASYAPIPWINVNAEYLQNSTPPADSPSNTSSVSGHSLYFSVSLPLLVPSHMGTKVVVQ